MKKKNLFFNYLKENFDNDSWWYGSDKEENKDTNIVFIQWCQIGANFFDYGEPEPETMNIDEKGKKLITLAKNAGIELNFLKCDECSGCAGW